jgi:hypothetical protein
MYPYIYKSFFVQFALAEVEQGAMLLKGRPRIRQSNTADYETLSQTRRRKYTALTHTAWFCKGAWYEKAKPIGL